MECKLPCKSSSFHLKGASLLRKSLPGSAQHAVERTLLGGENCADVLMLLAAARGSINGLMAEVLEDHIRLHLLQEGRAPLTPDLGEELIDLVRAYLK
jgi:DNA-binding FrmR family transcriptional regulator